ncbi:hypothetical protein GGU11DRAFT_579903 [Lentinula aff. detonsa]|nr:hypothetical protein GGU11DRAFT_579903 [Lentinula aff. detonsa]
MLSRACHRCRGTEHQPSKHLLTCQACHKTWHHCCHIPMVTESEMCARMKGTLRNVGSTIGEETPLSLENWLCRRCCKTQNLGNTKSHFNQPQSRLRDAATKLVREQDVVVISDSDSDDIQFVGLRPSSGALSQRVGQHPSPSVVKELESEKGTAYLLMSASISLIADQSTQVWRKRKSCPFSQYQRCSHRQRSQFQLMTMAMDRVHLYPHPNLTRQLCPQRLPRTPFYSPGLILSHTS